MDGSRTTLAEGAWRTVWALAFVYTMAVVDRTIMLILIPGIKATLVLDDTQVSLLLAFSFAVCFAFAGIPLGMAADRWNRRNLLIAGVAGWGVATFACGLVHSFWQFFAARMATGACMAVMAPAAISMLADLFPAERRGRPTGILMACSMFGGVLSNFLPAGFLYYFERHPPGVWPLIGEVVPWQTAFFGAGILTLLAVPLLAMVREPVREGHTAAARDEPEFSIIGHLRRHWAMFLLLFFAFISIALVGNGVGLSWPAVFMRSGGLTPVQTGLLLGFTNIFTGAAVAVAGGWLSDWAARKDRATGRPKLAAAGLAIQALTLLPLFAPSSVAGIAVTLTVNVILTGIVATAVFSLLPDLVPPGWRARLIAVYQFLGNLVGFGLGPTMVALVTNRVLQDESRVADAMLIFGLPMFSLSALLVLLAVPFLRRLREAEA